MKNGDLFRIIKQRTEEIIPETDLINKLNNSQKTKQTLRIKYGIDPTGADVHIGHMVPIRKMREFQDLGHTGVIIIGDFTARIGDPTGRDITRPPLSTKIIQENAERYMDQLYTVLDKSKTEVRWQSEWFDNLKLDDILNMLSKFTLAQFLAHDTFRKRYESGFALSMHEIMYPLLQGYDSVAISADIELGATEQKFNILIGRDMQAHFGMEQQVAMLFPILMGTDGQKKMSKSYDNYIAIYDSPNEKYGKVMSIPDNLLINYFELATNEDDQEINDIKKELADGINPKSIKQRLARKIVELYHGEENALVAEQAFDKVFSKKDIPDDIREFKCNQSPIWIVSLLTDGGLCKSKGEARRMIRQNAITIGKEIIKSEDDEIEVEDGTVVKVGKRRFLKLRYIQGKNKTEEEI